MNPFHPLYRLAHMPEPTGYQHEQRRWMLDRVLAEASSGTKVHRVVEIGCGDGWVCRELAARFEFVVGFDINPARIGEAGEAANILLAAGSAEEPPVADDAADLIISIAVLEHVSDRVATLRRLSRLLAANGRMIHVVPTANWKVFQWLGFYPDAVRKELRGLTRALAGVKRDKAAKYYAGRECNNPQIESRRRWYRKLVPRVHGAYASNFDELRQWRVSSWRRQAREAGLEVVKVIALGAASPYAFGVSRPLGRFTALPPLATNVALVLARHAGTPRDS